MKRETESSNVFYPRVLRKYFSLQRFEPERFAYVARSDGKFPSTRLRLHQLSKRLEIHPDRTKHISGTVDEYFETTS